MNAIILTLYCEALVLFALIAMSVLRARHGAAKHERGALAAGGIAAGRHAC